MVNIIECPRVLRIGDHVLDLDLPHNEGKGYDYEQVCLKEVALAKEFSTLLVLGPGFVVKFLSQYGHIGCQPDVIMFEHQPKYLVLDGFMVIQAGHICDGDVKGNIKGIDRIISQMRGYPTVFMLNIINLIGDATLPFDIPRSLKVPKDVSEVKVYFAGPKKLKLGIAAKQCPYQVSQKHYLF